MSAVPMTNAVTACQPPPIPCCQMTIPAEKASKIAIQARTSAPASVESAGTISSAPERTMITATNVAASENSAMRRAQTASRETGASVNDCRRIQGRLVGLHIKLGSCRAESQRHYICPGKARLGFKEQSGEFNRQEGCRSRPECFPPAYSDDPHRQQEVRAPAPRSQLPRTIPRPA